MSTAVLDRARAAEREQSQQAEESYAALVVSVADGTEPEAGDVLAILQAAGKTSADLANAVHARQHRNELRAQLAAVQRGNERRAEITRLVADSAAELQAAQERHNQFCWPLQTELADINQRSLTAIHAERELRDSAPKRFHQRQDAIERELYSLEAAIREAQEHLERAQSKFAIERANEKLAQFARSKAKLVNESNALVAAMLTA